MTEGTRRRILSLLQYGVGIVALAWLVSQVDWARTVEHLAGIGPAVAIGLVVVTAAEFVTRFAMWHVLLNARGETRFRTTARIDVVIKFVNHLIPSRVSGRSLAPIVLRHYTDHDWDEAVPIAALNTGLYAVCYGIVATIGIALFAGRLSPGLVFVLGLSTALYLVVGGVLFSTGWRAGALTRLSEWVRAAALKVPVLGERLGGVFDRLPSLAAEFTAVFRDLSSQPRVLVGYALSWLGTLMIAPGLRVWLLLGTFDVTFTPIALLPVAVVMAYSITVLPLTPGGIGVTEATAALVFVALGVPEEVIVPVIFIDRLLGVYLPALVGWYPAVRLDLSGLLSSAE